MLNDEQSVFTTALEIQSAAERAVYVRSACGRNDSMRGRIESLLESHQYAGLLDAPLIADVADIALDAEYPDAETPGTQIDRYTIVEVLGEGGFGIVYKAQQNDPIRRVVALKVIKLGMDTEQIVSRFRAERQALALMDHPNIASVYDAGATDSGRPFFVMELVDGISITDFCDEQQLSIHERLKLFVHVCRAIQHAHEKGVIHRDVKPSNVLVTRKDGAPFPKVIDFGIAAVADDSSPATQAAIETGNRDAAGPWAGTPAYMSPEQVVLGKAHVDLRTDVYGLGVLLYELLTGRTPHVCLQSDRHVGVREIRRRIEQDEPRSPSSALREMSGEGLSELAELRQTDSKRLVSICRGDLDCIVMKSLRRQPRERYDSVLDLARDIERLLRNEPIAARTSNIVYRGRKFVQRHFRTLVGTAMVAALFLLTAFPLGYSWYTQKQQASLRRLEYRHKIDQALAEADRLHEQALVSGSEDLQTITEAVAAARRAEALLDTSTPNTELRQRVHGYVAKLRKEESDRQFLASIKLARIDIVGESPEEQHRTEQALLNAFEALGIQVDADSPQAVASILEHSTSEVKERAIAAIDIWAGLYCDGTPTRKSWLLDVARESDPNPWRLRLREAIQQMDPSALESLAVDHQLNQQSTSCFIVLIHALQKTKSRHFMTVLHRAADTYPNVLFFNAVLGNVYSQRAGRFDTDAAQKAIRYLSAALALQPTEPRILNNLGMNLSRVGEHEHAIRMLQKSTRVNPEFWYSWYNLGLADVHCGDFESADMALRESLKLLPTVDERQPVEKLLKRTINLLRNSRTIDASESMLRDKPFRYTTARPENWPDESPTTLATIPSSANWPTGYGSFGSRYFSPQTEWLSDELWLQRSFDAAALNEGESLVLVVRALATVTVYVDGKQVVDSRYTRNDPVCIPIDDSRPSLETKTASTRHTVTIHAVSNGTERSVDVDVVKCNLAAVKTHCQEIANDTIRWLSDHYADEPSTATLVELLSTYE